jgi:hypothetical protein
MKRRDSARWEPYFVESGEGSKVIGERAPTLLGIEREPDIVLARSDVVAFRVSAQRDHQSTPLERVNCGWACV